MKLGKKDQSHSMLITGIELFELKKHTWSMVEAFGLDRRIEQYKGKKPITFFRWDLECLIDVLSMELTDQKVYPDQNSTEYLACKALYDRIKKGYDTEYPD